MLPISQFLARAWLSAKWKIKIAQRKRLFAGWQCEAKLVAENSGVKASKNVNVNEGSAEKKKQIHRKSTWN